ncbi:anion permease [Bacillaceae bacterium S4-13-56]
MKSYLWNRQIIIPGLILALALLSIQTLFSEFTNVQKLTILLLAIAVYLWTLAPIPTGTSSILILALILIFGLVDDIDDAVVGFLSPALYFILMVSLISHALVKVGIDRLIARFIINTSKKGAMGVVITLPVVILLLPILLPSAVARFKIFLPLIDRMNEYFGFEEKSLFRRFCMFVIGMMNQNSTMVIFTGGGFPILAAQLLKDYKVSEDMSWMGWFLHIAPPLWIGMTIVALFVWNFLKLDSNEDELERMTKMGSESIKKEEMPHNFWGVLGLFLIMIVVWILFDEDTVPLVLPPMILVVIYSLPKFNLITNQTIRNYDWENFLLLGSSFSVGILMETNGTAGALARELIYFVPNDGSVAFKVIVIAIFIFCLRFLFIVPSSAMVVIFPIAISYADQVGLSKEGLSFLVVMIIGGVMVLPIHSPTAFFAYSTGVFTKKEQYTIGVFSSFIITALGILSAIFYWD